MYNPFDKKRVQLEMARARWALEIAAGRGAKFQISHHHYQDLAGNRRIGFNVYGVDRTRDARDPKAGEPILLNDYPFDSEEEAQEFAKDALIGRKVFQFGGKRFNKKPVL